MSKQTAVEWLIEQVNHKGVVYNNYNIITDIPKEIIEQAKAMEREQIVDAFEVKKNRYVKKFYSDDTYSTVNEIIYTDGNQYYNETYGGDK